MATVLDLLQALNRGDLPPLPPPATPMSLGPLQPPSVPEYTPSQVTEPPQAPIDPRIFAQIMALQGPAPTAPAPLSRGQRIANALIGFSAGLQGNGPQFLEQLERPKREYQQQLSEYNANRQRLGLAATEVAQRDQEARTRRAQEVSDREFRAEVDREARRLGLAGQKEFALFQDALVARRQREDDERMAAEARRKEKAQQERDARVFASQLGRGPGAAKPEIAEELGRYYAGISEKLSPAAASYLNAQAKRAQILASRPIGGGGATKPGRPMAVLEDGQTVPITKVDTKTGRAVINGRPVKVVGYTGGGASSQPQAAATGPKNDPLGIR